jgi:hypothetical protein
MHQVTEQLALAADCVGDVDHRNTERRSQLADALVGGGVERGDDRFRRARQELPHGVEIGEVGRACR